MEFNIDLTRNEKRTFYRFFALYLGGSLFLMMLIAILYYQNEKKLYFDLTKTRMQNVVSNISSRIIFTHMSDSSLDLKQFLKNDIYKISFYDKDKNLIIGNLNEKIDFTKQFIQNEQNFTLVNDSTYGHLGVAYIVIQENLLFKSLKKMQVDIITLFLIVYSILALIGFYLAKLLLKPIKDEREKLNNFIKDTTHELNTPISAILMSSESEELTKKQIKRIQLAANKISEIYKDLTYIFLEDNSEKEDFKNINLKEVIISQLKYFEALAERKKISISTSLEDTNYFIDENDFIRLFNNLLSNAVKYNKMKGSIFIELKNNTLTIKDTGIGIEEKKINDIFNRYFRATTQSGGFGIGLNIVKNITTQYNIDIQVDSKVNEGTTFILKF
ncbi:sensor histidine kinase [Arcobacter arenosus]|uniref:sensor histidine kinase n=1 Tax=Arcobacter arenosus TaxID=2576037 RepID=UPI003BA8CFF3